MGAGVGRRVAAAVGLWAVVLAGTRVVVLLPEDCPPVTVADADATVAAAVAWFERNQNADGTWLYRYDRAAAADVGGYNTVRHSGVTMSLYQAAGAGFDGALEVADDGAAWAFDNLVPAGDGRAFEPGSGDPSSGASALLLAGLAERRAATGDTAHDGVMADLGAFLVAMTDERGAVHAAWDRRAEAPVPDVWSSFYTGETMWALALAERELPGHGFGETAMRIGRYIATERDEVEGYWPDVPDHWAAYGFAVLTTELGVTLDDAEVDYLRRQAAFGGVQARYESQRDDAFPRWLLRGRRTLGAGLGTVGEQLDNLERVAAHEPGLADLRDDIAERATCVAGMLAERQADGDGWAEPDRVDGAWFQFDVTQMDDQQHALSAVLLARPHLDGVADDVDDGTGDDTTDDTGER